MIFVIFSITILVLYFIRIFSWKAHWERYGTYTPASPATDIGVSIVVPFRNEKDCIAGLCSSLEQQDYPLEKLEVILVNDHSDDGSDKIARNFCDKRPAFRLINNDSNHSGKKQALKAGIRQASNSLVIITDADCRLPLGWVSTFAGFHQNTKAEIILGLVDIDAGAGFMEQFQEMEFLSLIASGAAAAAAGMPIYGNGASFAFTKDAFNMLNDPLNEKITSGDDTFFIHQGKRAGKKILLLKSQKALVRVSTLKNWPSYLNQRIRWVSKSRHYSDKDTLLTALLVLAVNTIILASMVMMTFNLYPWLFPVLVVWKLIPDYSFMQGFMKFYGKRPTFICFLGYSLIYPAITVMFAFSGFFFRYSWKGRQFSK